MQNHVEKVEVMLWNGGIIYKDTVRQAVDEVKRQVNKELSKTGDKGTIYWDEDQSEAVVLDRLTHDTLSMDCSVTPMLIPEGSWRRILRQRKEQLATVDYGGDEYKAKVNAICSAI